MFLPTPLFAHTFHLRKEEIDQSWTIRPAHQVLFCLSTARRAPSKLYDSERLCNLQAVEDTLQLQVVIVGGSAETFRGMSLQTQVVRSDHGFQRRTVFFPRTSSCVPCRQSLTRATALQSATATPRRLLCCYCYTSTAVLLMLVLLLLLAHAARNPPQTTSVCLLRSTIWRFSVAVVGRRRQNTGTPYLQLPLLVIH